MRSQRLDPLIKVTQQRQDEAARTVAEREQAVREQQERLEALRRYAEEYAASPANATISPALLVNRIAFRERLNAAVVQQAGIVDRSRQLSDVERARLMLASRQTLVLEKLADSYRAQEAQVEQAKAQRELDEIGSRRSNVTALAISAGEDA
ncbi:flagellar export protein FliJ [Pseudoxanthomonas spadix]|uniref:flagellar export protein FliJ n=1 Tax=Pseudoxanthomonas spadix TaxID=415229 RepID=UPI000EFF5099|nr:flagellar export protein FliJ [Pseudoxanthomonas spadix]MBP3973199.1 flagellar export protein FliJ [Pseudoxanthomonas spadix]RMW95213.1 flagellar export protein FliJ [Pseudoxanthomonas spadix]